MTIKRSFASALALSLSLTACATSHAFTPEADVTTKTQMTLGDQFQQIRIDIAGGATVDQAMLGRINQVIVDIDSMLASNPASESQLGNLRRAAVQLRTRINEAISGNAEALVNQLGAESMMTGPSIAAPSVAGSMVPAGGQVVNDVLVSEQVVGSTPLNGTTFGGGGAISGGSLGGGGGAAGGGAIGGGGMGLLAVGGVAAGIAASVSDDDNDNNVGAIASPSGI